MEEKRLDFNAPLLSVRRNAAKNELSTEEVGNPGLVPFTWEQKPGRPKDRIVVDGGDDEFTIDEKELKGRDEEVVSSNESFVDCSASDCSDRLDDVETSGSSSKDPEVREFMMGRFLPAAKAVATGPLEINGHRRLREKTRDLNYRRPPVRLPYQHTPNTVTKFAYDHEIESYADEDEDEEDDYAGASHFNRACGLIPRFCLTSSLPLMNPIQEMKVSNLHRHSHAKVSDHGSVTQTEDESWDAVYKYKRGHRDDPPEDESKLTSESNQLTYWSDSQTIDESSSHHSSQSPFLRVKDSLGVSRRELDGTKTVSFESCERANEKYRNLRPCQGEHHGEGSMSPSIERTIGLVNAMGTPHSKSSSIDYVTDIPDTKSTVMVVDDGRMEDSPVLQTCEKHELQPKNFESIESGLSSNSDRSNIEEIDCKNDGQQALKFEDKEKNGSCLALSLLPPPLPNSPSDSWLQRTLPSVSSKYPFTQSLLNIQVQNRKQDSWASPKDFKRENYARSIKQKSQHTRFAQALTKPASQQYEP